MKLNLQNMKSIESPTAGDVKRELKKLKSYGTSSFLSLENERGYIQVAGGPGLFVIEVKKSDSNEQFRVYQDRPICPFPNGTSWSFSAGELKVNQDEWFNREQVEKILIDYLKENEKADTLKLRALVF